MIQMAVDFCKCHLIPADQCIEVTDMISRGVPLSDLTYEVLCPGDVRTDANRMVIHSERID